MVSLRPLGPRDAARNVHRARTAAATKPPRRGDFGSGGRSLGGADGSDGARRRQQPLSLALSKRAAQSGAYLATLTLNGSTNGEAMVKPVLKLSHRADG